MYKDSEILDNKINVYVYNKKYTTHYCNIINENMK